MLPLALPFALSGLAAAAASALAPAPPPPAASLDARTVAADALWVLHLDLRALRSSRLFDLLAGEVGTNWSGASLAPWIATDDGAQGAGESLIEQYGFDPLVDLLALTVYGTGEEHQQAVVLLTTTSRIEGALEKLHDAYPTFGYVESAGYRFHAIEEQDGALLLHVHGAPAIARGAGERAAVSGTRTLVIGSDARRLGEAIAVLEAHAPNLELSPHSVLREVPGPTAFAWAAAVQDPEHWSWEVESKIGGMVRDARAEIGERDGRLYVDATLATATPEDAADVAKSVEGLAALARLMGPRGPHGDVLREVLAAFSLRMDGARVTALFEMDTDRVLQLATQLDTETDGTRDLSEAR